MADTEQIVIEFISETSGLDGAIDLMVKLGQVDKATAESFKKTSAEINNRAAALNNVNKANTASQAENKKAQKSLEDLAASAKNASKTIQDASLQQLMEGFADGVNDALKEAGVSVDQFGDALKTLPDAMEGTTQKAITMKGQLRALKEELSLLESQGKGNTKEFEDLSIKAAHLEDQIGDTNARIKALASDTRVFDGISQGVTGLVAGFQAAEGAAFLFGDENKDLQETLVKLNAVMAISNGLSQIQAVLQKQSAAVALITLGQQKLEIIQTQLQTAAESENVIVKYASIAASRILNALQAASPAGLLLITIGALAAAYALLSDREKTETDILKENNAQRELALKVADKYVKDIEQNADIEEKRIQKRIELAELEKKSIEERRQLQLQLDKQRIESAQQAARDFNLLTFGDHTKTLQENLSILKNEITEAESKVALLNINKDTNEKEIEAIQKQIELKRQQYDEGLGFIDKERQSIFDASTNRIKYEQEVQDAIKKARSTQLSDQKAIDEALLLQAKEGSDEQKKLRQQVVKDQLAIDLAGENLTQAQRKLLTLRANAEILNIEKEFIKARNELFQKVDLNDIDERLARVEKGSAAELELNKQKLDVIANAEIQAVKDKYKNDIDGELIIASETRRINDETIRKKQDMDDAYFQGLRQKLLKAFADQNAFDLASLQSRISTSEKGSLNELQLQKDAIESSADAKKLAIEQELLSEDQKAQRIKEIDQETIDQKKKLDEEYNKALLDNAENEVKKEADIRKELKQAEVEITKDLIGAVFQIFNNNLQAETNAKLSTLNRLRDKELANTNLTESQKEQINEKYRQRERAIKRRAFQQEKEAAMLQAAISGAVAVVEALPNYVLAAVVAASTAAEIAIIASKPVPEFAHGTERVKGPGTRKSDSILARLSVDERVVPADVNMDYFPALNAIQKRKISPGLANALLADTTTGYSILNRIPSDYHINERDLAEMMMITNNSIRIDEDKLAKKIADRMDDRFYELISEVRSGNSSKYFEELIRKMDKNRYNHFTGR